MSTKDTTLPPLPEKGYLGDDASYGYDEFDMQDYARAAIAAQAQQCPDILAGHKLLEDGKTAIPVDWTPLRLEWEPGYPEDVAFGPQRMMDRLKKWLDRHFATLAAAKPRDWMAELGFEVRHDASGVWLLIDDCGNEREATLNERVLWGALNSVPDPAAAPQAEPHPEREPERKPLTDAQIEKLREQPFSTSNPFCPCDSKTMRKAVWAAERAHGIGTKGD